MKNEKFTVQIHRITAPADFVQAALLQLTSTGFCGEVHTDPVWAVLKNACLRREAVS